jgi:hypothetical protein
MIFYTIHFSFSLSSLFVPVCVFPSLSLTISLSNPSPFSLTLHRSIYFSSPSSLVHALSSLSHSLALFLSHSLSIHLFHSLFLCHPLLYTHFLSCPLSLSLTLLLSHPLNIYPSFSLSHFLTSPPLSLSVSLFLFPIISFLFEETS